ncbi:MAG TPA: hypothetical protein VLV18_11230, partial [Terriglobales bacterium]|nr:hypothetical protein [Terriglobales bacterium]
PRKSFEAQSQGYQTFAGVGVRRRIVPNRVILHRGGVRLWAMLGRGGLICKPFPFSYFLHILVACENATSGLAPCVEAASD